MTLGLPCRFVAGLLGAAVLAGCASLTGTTEIVSVDSEPRGVEVQRLDDLEKLGRTPLFTREKRARRHGYVFLGSEGRKHARIVQCSLRWPTTLVANGIVAGVLGASNPASGLAIGLGAIGIDFMQGAAWTCDDPFVAKLPQLKAPPPPCRRFLVVPPAHYDEKLSDALVLAWIKRSKASLGGCHTYVEQATGKELFAYLNIDHETPVRNLKTLGDRNVKALGYRAQASDLVILETTDRRGNAVVARPVIYDMHTRKVAAREASLGVTPQTGAGPGKTGHPEWLIRAVNFMPNAVSLGFSTQTIHDNRTEKGSDLKILEEHDERSLPTYVSGWSVHSVDHPEGFAPWDVHVAITPELSTGYIQKRFKMARTDAVGFPTDEPFDHRFAFFYVAALANAGVTGHTPLGAFGASIGAGMAYFDVHDDIDRLRRAAPIFSVGVQYTAFVTRDVFLLVDASTYGLLGSRKPLFEHELLRIDGFQSIRVGLGYFLPVLRRFARDLL